MVVPTRLELAPAEGRLRIWWPDGQCQSLDHARLRAACRCAACRSLPSEEGAAQAVRITALEEMGYGIQIVFSDGHDRGIYPWPYLQAL
ncbi:MULTISPECIES: gamma-butyrobetaine hydroxylase-like domain-containing protein [Cupriavidus]|uniref:gamma-butyrobetaine hydroxylase-like domain-containing protein n=1 Tax=Cupriavidus sp. DF5525 TaxID=3160989 RepID=UPI0003FDD02A